MIAYTPLAKTVNKYVIAMDIELLKFTKKFFHNKNR